MPKVLVIESDPETRSTIADVLAAEGYTPVPLPAPDQAIEHLQGEDAPCMVLLDLGQREDAVAFLQWLREHEELRGLRVAVMSGWHRPERRLADFGDHISRVLNKPFNMSELLSVIEQHCGPAARS
jgi:DNA-binding response OmpR family regulator